jgi:hypothetical protein
MSEDNYSRCRQRQTIVEDRVGKRTILRKKGRREGGRKEGREGKSENEAKGPL